MLPKKSLIQSDQTHTYLWLSFPEIFRQSPKNILQEDLSFWQGDSCLSRGHKESDRNGCTNISISVSLDDTWVFSPFLSMFGTFSFLAFHFVLNCYWTRILAILINTNWSEVRQEIQARLIGAPAEAGGCKNKQWAPLLAVSEGAELVPYKGVRVGVCQRSWWERWF